MDQTQVAFNANLRLRAHPDARPLDAVSSSTDQSVDSGTLPTESLIRAKLVNLRDESNDFDLANVHTCTAYCNVDNKLLHNYPPAKLTWCPHATNKSQHPHLAQSRQIGEDMAYKFLSSKGCKQIIDVGGVTDRHIKMDRHITVVNRCDRGPRDVHRLHNHREVKFVVQDVRNFRGGDGFMFIHSIYYLDTPSIQELLQRGPVVALLHMFVLPNIITEWDDSTRHLEAYHTIDKVGNITMMASGNRSQYMHQFPTFLADFSIYVIDRIDYLDSVLVHIMPKFVNRAPLTMHMEHRPFKPGQFSFYKRVDVKIPLWIREIRLPWRRSVKVVETLDIDAVEAGMAYMLGKTKDKATFGILTNRVRDLYQKINLPSELSVPILCQNTILYIWHASASELYSNSYDIEDFVYKPRAHYVIKSALITTTVIGLLTIKKMYQARLVMHSFKQLNIFGVLVEEILKRINPLFTKLISALESINPMRYYIHAALAALPFSLAILIHKEINRRKDALNLETRLTILVNQNYNNLNTSTEITHFVKQQLCLYYKSTLGPVHKAMVHFGLVFSDILPIVHASTIDNEIEGIRTRVLPTFPFNVVKLCLFIKFYKSHHYRQLSPEPHHPSFHLDIPKEDLFTMWNERFNLRRQQDQFRAQVEIDRNDKLPTTRKAFVKVERLVGRSRPDYYKFGKPRIIQDVSRRFHSSVGPLIYAYSLYAKEYWNLDYTLVYCSGYTGLQLGESFSQQDYPCYVLTDVSSFDASVNSEIIKARNNTLWYKIVENVNQFMCFKSMENPKGFGMKSGLFYSVRGKRCSGDQNTSLDNTDINFAIHLYAIYQKIGFIPHNQIKIWALGDDCVLAGPLWLRDINFKGELAQIGFDMKVKIVEDPDLVDFCSQYFWRVGQKRVLGGKPGRILEKIGFSTSDNSTFREVLLTTQYHSYFVPMVHEYINQGLKLTTKQRATYVDHSRSSGCLENPTDETYTQFEKIYGLTKTDVVDFSLRLGECWTVPVAFCTDWRVRRMADIDCLHTSLDVLLQVWAQLKILCLTSKKFNTFASNNYYILMPNKKLKKKKSKIASTIIRSISSKPVFRPSKAKHVSGNGGYTIPAGTFAKGGSLLGGVLGGLVGGEPGAALGGWIGDMGGSLLAKITGTGGYKVTSNSIVNGPPIFSDSMAMRIAHREFVTDIDGSEEFSIQSFVINAGNPLLFPWASTLANNFEQFAIKGMVAEFKSTSGTAISSTDASLGTVIISTIYDVAQPVFTSKREMDSYMFTTTCVPFNNMLHPIECAKSRNVLGAYYVDGSTASLGSTDQRFHDLGRLCIATQGMQSPYTIGELWVSYDIHLSKPKLLRVPTTPAPVYLVYNNSANRTHPIGQSTGGSYSNSQLFQYDPSVFSYGPRSVGTHANPVVWYEDPIYGGSPGSQFQVHLDYVGAYQVMVTGPGDFGSTALTHYDNITLHPAYTSYYSPEYSSAAPPANLYHPGFLFNAYVTTSVPGSFLQFDGLNIMDTTTPDGIFQVSIVYLGPVTTFGLMLKAKTEKPLLKNSVVEIVESKQQPKGWFH